MSGFINSKQEAWSLIKSIYGETSRLGLDQTFNISEIVKVARRSGNQYSILRNSSGKANASTMRYMENAGIVEKVGYSRDDGMYLYRVTSRVCSMLQKNPDAQLGVVVSKLKTYGKNVRFVGPQGS